MSWPEDHRKLVFLPFEEASTPRTGGTYLGDRWWCAHPEKGVIFFDRFPQCNSSEAIVRKIQGQLYPWATIQHMPVVFIPARLEQAP